MRIQVLLVLLILKGSKSPTHVCVKSSIKVMRGLYCSSLSLSVFLYVCTREHIVFLLFFLRVKNVEKNKNSVHGHDDLNSWRVIVGYR